MTPSDQTNAADNDAALRLMNGLADPARRSAAAAALAGHWGVDAMLILIRDQELGVLRPAPGFRQTLPGGPTWRDLFDRCQTPGMVRGEVAFPDRQTRVPFYALVSTDSLAVMVLLGAKSALVPPLDLDALGFPLLVALLQAESRAIASAGLVAEARSALARATILTGSLDAARSELARALTDSDRLNHALRELNATLEERVAERTRQFEAEMADRQKAEAALAQAQKMEAVGQLTGGIAHDFNNLLTGISGSLELLATRISQGRLNELNRYVTAAQGAAKRAAALTHRLLAFARRQTLDPKPTNVNRLVLDMEELIRRTMGPAIEIEVVGAAGLWTTLIDPNQLENALLNLCINARDAMPDGGRLTIETANKWLDGRTGRERSLSPGQYLSLCVTDTGTGMTPEVIERAFDPFYTTKPIGQGTGLGLSMVYGFARQSGGQIRIYSEVGQGTTVCLYLPRYHGEAGEVSVSAETAQVSPRCEAGETVMVVDDEPTVRMLVVEVLEELGYTTIEAADGPGGLQVLNSNVRIDLLITDVGLPGGMNGRQLADAGRALRPGLKVLFITGYAENAVVGNGHLEPGMHVMTKPFEMDVLASRIRECIVET